MKQARAARQRLPSTKPVVVSRKPGEPSWLRTTASETTIPYRLGEAII